MRLRHDTRFTCAQKLTHARQHNPLHGTNFEYKTVEKIENIDGAICTVATKS